jgi:cobalt-zinc-cadmium efflux system outer membrane protein
MGVHLARQLCIWFGFLFLTGCVGTGFSASAGSSVPEHAAHSDLAGAQRSTAASGDSLLRQAQLRELLDREQIGLAELLMIAELKNPEVQAALNELGAVVGRTRQAGLYPNPTIELAAEDIPADDIRLSRSNNTVAIVQPVIVAGRRSAAVSAGSAEQEARSLTVQARLREVQGDVRLVYVDLLAVKEAIALHQELLDLARQTLRIGASRFEARAIPEAEVIESQVEVHELELGRARLERQVSAHSARLCSLLGGVEIPVDRISGSLPGVLPQLDPDRLRTEVRRNHPAILAAERDIDAADRRIQQAEAERTPDIDLRLAYGRDAAADESILEAGIRIPLPVFDRNQGRILETRHLAAKARRDAEARTNDLLSELAAAHASEMTARDEAGTLRDQIVPATERAFAQAREAYAAGKIGHRDFLRAQRTLARARFALWEALRDLNVARARLWRIVGPGIEE